MKKIAVFLLLFSIGLHSHAQEVFQFRYRSGQRFHIEGIVNEDLYKNDILVKSVRLKNIGDLTVTAVQGNKALHEGVFQYFTSQPPSDNFVLEQEYPTRFYRDIYGNYEIEESYFMPVVRGVPTFPKTPLDIGDQWRSKAFEAHDFRKVYGITHPVILPASVSYQYLGNMAIDGEKIAKLSINYVINYTLRYQQGTISIKPLPYRIIGYFNQLYFWNLDRGLPHSYKENFDYVLILTSGEVHEYVGTSHGTLVAVEEMGEDERMIEDIEAQLKKTMPWVEVTGTDEGIVINIGEILFQFDSDELTQTAGEDLDNIVEVLKGFSDRKIRVIGHTDNIGPQDYNLSLSLRRAKRTARELKKRMPSFAGHITYMGMGESKPIATNETEEGRKKNRRVEIIILNE